MNLGLGSVINGFELTEQRIDYDKGLRDFVEKAFRKKMPALIDFSLKNQTVGKSLRDLKRHTTGSVDTAYQYVYGDWRYQLWAKAQPDQLLRECYGPQGEPLPAMLLKHAQLVDDFVAYLQDLNLAPGTVANFAKGVKALYRSNGLRLELPRYPRTLRYPGRSPTLEQLQRILSVADPHERVIVLLLSTGGFREGTLCKLRYGNLRDDFERGIIPCIVHVEPQITKGLGWGSRGHWTFLPRETVEALKLYLDGRKRGNRWFEPERLSMIVPWSETEVLEPSFYL